MNDDSCVGFGLENVHFIHDASLAPTMRLLLAAATIVLLSGCSAPDEIVPLSDHTYAMHLSGMPTRALVSGESFNVSVIASMGHGANMHALSDHIGAHFWNATQSDPNAALPVAIGCGHAAGELPGTFTAKCTAPTTPGTYYLRAHARITEGDVKHNWWGDETSFHVA